MPLNFKEIGTQSSDFESLPEGWYTLKADKAELRTSPTSGNEYISVTFSVNEGQYKNRLVWHNFTLTAKSLVWLYAFLKAVGSNLIDKEDADTSMVENEIVGKIVSAYLEPSATNTGKATNTIKKFTAVDNSTKNNDEDSSDMKVSDENVFE